jgi:hypothetical protein
VTVLEIVVGGSLVVRAWLLEHLIEDAPAGGPRGFLRSAATTKSSAAASCLPC